MILLENHAMLFDALKKAQTFSFDTETTGLKWYSTDYPIILSFATLTEEFVVDLRKVSPEPFFSGLRELLLDPEIHLIGTNTKFDLHMVKAYEIKARVSDTQILMRLNDSDSLKTGLEALGELVGIAKDDTVKKWIQKNKAYRYEFLPNGDPVKIPRYDAVPEEMLYTYAARDARVTFEGYHFLVRELEKLDAYNRTLAGDKSIFNCLHKEEDLLKVLLNIEKRGVLLDLEYTSQGLHHEENHVKEAREDYQKLTGRDFVDSSKALVEAFGSDSAIVRSAPRTEKGNVSFTDSFLSSLNEPVAEAILRFRKSHKKSGTYYSNFVYLKGSDGRIHTNFRQSQTSTGRLSSSDPNLQNVSNDDDSRFPIRGCFIAPEGYDILSIDYQAQEMRVMIDMAGQEDLAREILNGKDVHQATADLLGIDRKSAKTINFGLLYGMGVTKMAGALDVPLQEAQRLKNEYFKGLQEVGSFTKRVVAKAEKGRLSNLAGRIYKFDKKFAYKAINYLIQGSSSEITKTAMIECEKFLQDKKTKLVLSVHDELVFYLHESEHYLVPELASIMKVSYTHDILPMDVGIEIGKRWSEMREYGT